MKPLCVDPPLYAVYKKGSLSGLSGSYVGDIIRAGTPVLCSECTKTQEKFEMTEDEMPPFTFSGLQLDKTDKGFRISQTAYVQSLKPLHFDAPFASFQSSRMKLAWLSHTHPGMQF